MFDTNRVAFSGFWWEGLDSSEKVSRVCNDLAQLGYRGVEWKETCFGSAGEALGRLKMAAEATVQSGLEVTDFVILRNLVTPEGSIRAANEVAEFVRAAADAGVDTVNIVSGPEIAERVSEDQWWKPAGPDWSGSWDSLGRSLEIVLAAAESANVVIALETLAGNLVHDYYSALELLRRFDSPRLAFTFDPSHFLIHGNDIGYAIRALADKIRLVHVKDAVGRVGVFGRDFLFPVLGEGAIDWQDFFAALKDIDYGGWMSIEFESFKYMYEVLGGNALEAARLSMTSYRELAQ